MAVFLTRHRAASAVLFAAAAGAVFVGTLQARPYSAVEVRGSEFIPAGDIAAACEIVAGEYDSSDMSAVQECLMSSGQFRSVEVRGEGTTLVVEVSELNDRPGRIEAGLAYDSRDGATINTYFERYNLFPGSFGSIDLRFAEEVQSFRTSLYRAEAFGNFDFGLDTEMRKTSYSDQGFTSKRVLIEPYLALPFAKGGRAELGIGYRRDEMTDVVAGSSVLFGRETGVIDAPYARLGVSYTSNPAENGGTGFVTGLSLSLDQYVWGLGTDQKTYETRIEADARFALAEQTSLLVGLRGGIVSGQSGHNTRAVDRFFIGGADFRGFAPRGLGPKDGDWFVGANNYYVTSVELQREVDELFGTTGRVGIFADIGSAWGLDDTLGGRIDDSRHVRSSVGLSLTLDLGNIPVSLFVAKPVDYQDGDDRQSFGMSFSTSF
ncbi:BamA/TamA family outer membrane protein [Xinfangfangia sp. D13-10-4-6]|uniref:BamA/TamA family outer membrane protein n=1 Tax=Pseudogemmobacter hezensis TaxID=2737662 RepID=UPI001553DE3B|nr:BamA/TamA family outer membrane protein [Pseudogemmobacter hezensis]NPD17292.1 BamA/TamA family outer membrane protein [Pseudogemmobacter hezensis]